MNGRIYDYNLGRFMSVDPFIQAPTSTQSVNPYSYIMNNPLSGTDPTGYAMDIIVRCGSNTPGCDDHIPDGPKDSAGQQGGGNSRDKGPSGGSSRAPAPPNNGSGSVSNVAPGSSNPQNFGSLQQNAANKQYPSYGNDKRFAKGYSSGNGDMSGVLSWTGPGQAVDAFKSGLNAYDRAVQEYDDTGSITSSLLYAGMFFVEKYTERKLKIGNGLNVPKSAGQLGREGEAAASAITGVGKNTQKFTVNGRTRVPDQVNASHVSMRNPLHITEVKNVNYQSFTRQLRDNVDLVGPGGRVDVFVRPNTKLSGPLRRAHADPTNPINIRPEL